MTILKQALEKNNNKNHSQRTNWGINLGNIKTRHPLNCGKCGSKNLKYKRGKKQGSIFAHCQNKDCRNVFQVNAKLAPYLQHLIEPDPPPEMRVCRYWGKKATVIDADYYSCSGCGAGLLNFTGGGASHE